MENNEAEQKRVRRIMYLENSFRGLSDSIKYNNICIIGVPEENTETGAENLIEEIIAEHFPNLGGRKQTSRCRRHRELPSKSTKAGQYQDIL